jgi:hypothetical protein
MEGHKATKTHVATRPHKRAGNMTAEENLLPFDCLSFSHQPMSKIRPIHGANRIAGILVSIASPPKTPERMISLHRELRKA